jgi:hypothetical protein
VEFRTAPPVVELGFHALAFVPAPEPGSLHDPRYTAWSRAWLPAEAWQPLDRDAPLLAALVIRAGPAWWLLQHLPFVHRDLATLVAKATLPVAALDPQEAIHPEAVAALCRLAVDHAPLVELQRTALALVARAYVHAHAAVVAPRLARAAQAVAPALALAHAQAPSLDGCDVLLTFALGARARAYGSTIVLGAPTGWNGLPPERPAVLLLHERAVTLAARWTARRDAPSFWASSEGVALRATEALVQGTPLEGAWQAWRAEIDTSGVEPVTAGDPRVLRTLAALREP